MDLLKNNVKEALDKNVYGNLEMDVAAKSRFLHNLQNRKEKRVYQKLRFTPLLAGMSAMVILVFLLSPFINKMTNTQGNIQQEVSGKFGYDVLIPKFEGYSLTQVVYSDSKRIGYKFLTMNFAINKGEIDPRFSGKEKLEAYEKEFESKVYYGPFLGDRTVSITYREGNEDIKGANIKNYNGIEVQYYFQKASSKSIYTAIVKTNRGFYNFGIFLQGGMTEADAEQIIEEFTRQLK